MWFVESVFKQHSVEEASRQPSFQFTCTIKHKCDYIKKMLCKVRVTMKMGFIAYGPPIQFGL